MPTQLTVPTATLGALQKLVTGYANQFQNPQPLLKAWGLRTLAEVDRIFKERGRPRWKPLAQSTFIANRGRAPLEGIRKTFDMQIAGRQVSVFTNHPAAVFQEFGTKGPYEIKPKHAKALALPFLPGRDAKGTRGSRPGVHTKAGLGRSTRIRPSTFFKPGAGKSVAVSNVSFYAKVIHPGLPARRMLPTEKQMIPILAKLTIAVITRKGGAIPI